MESKLNLSRPTSLLLVIAAFFVANALIAECIGGKLFNLDKLLGIDIGTFSLLGQDNLSYTLTCGVLLWPLEFVITDIINEYYGPKIVKRISYIAIGLISYAFIMFYVAMETPPSDFWIHSNIEKGVPNMQFAFAAIFGQGMWIILGSLVAFLVGQLVDVYIFHKIKKRTGDKMVWLRATGSTVISQLVDSFLVLFIAFYLGSGWSIQLVLAICLVNYSYKFLAAIVLTPLIYGVESLIDRYLGHEVATAMKIKAASGK